MITSAILLAVVASASAGPLLGTAAHTEATMQRFDTDKENAKIANKSLEFVNILKQDLRRNNEDYSNVGMRDQRHELMSNDKGQLTRGTPRRSPFTSGAANRGSMRPPNNQQTREQDHPLMRASANKLPTIHAPTKQNDARRGLNFSLNPFGASLKQGATFRSFSHLPNVFKKVRVDNLKRLIDKGKVRLRNLVRQNPAPGGFLPVNKLNQNPAPPAQPQGAATPLRSPTTTVATQKESRDAEDGTSPVAPEPVTSYKPGKWPLKGRGLAKQVERQGALRQHHMRGSPSPDQLDMAPARGPEIQIIRFKGRLCQRSMLNLEGPVYNKQGITVMPPHRPEHAYGRQFPNTRQPNIILPRCCNCCKKSVLGCQ